MRHQKLLQQHQHRHRDEIAPREAVARIYRDTRKILEEPEFRQKQLVDRGYEVVGSGPDEFAAYIAKDSESRARAVTISGAKAE